MTTIKNIKENLNINDLRKNDQDFIYEGVSDEVVLNWQTACLLALKFRDASKYNSYQVSYSNTISSYLIKNEDAINTLRELYKLTKNTFVKSVVVKVGQDKKFTDKQISIITDEMVKFENLTLKF